MPADRVATAVCTCSRCSRHSYRDKDGVEHPGQLRRPGVVRRHLQLEQYKGDTARFNIVSATVDLELDVDQIGNADLPVLHRDYMGNQPDARASFIVCVLSHQ